MNDDAIKADTTIPKTVGPDSAQPPVTTLIPDAPLVCEELTKESIDWRHYTHQVAPTEGAHSQEVARKATAACRANVANHTDAGDEEYQPSSNSVQRTLALATMCGTLIDFLDEFERLTEKHAFHRNLVSTEHKASINYEQNSRPLMIKRDMDFSENYSIKNYRALQSQYWTTITCTLFVYVVTTWLQAKKWNCETGLLKIGEEVTAYGEKAGEEINMNSFWGVVTKVINGDRGLYEITDGNEKTHCIERADLRL